MKVVTAAEMRDVDRRTMELGIDGPILMENAGIRAVDFLAEQFGSPARHRIVILCGKGNNGGDGYVVARQLLTRFRVGALHVVGPGDGSAPQQMFEAAGGVVHPEITPEMRRATLVVDAVLGTGVEGAARGRALDLIREINTGFPEARVLAIDVPSGMNTDSGSSVGEVARADATITFTAPKLCHALSPNCDRLGVWRVGHIGSPASLMEGVRLHLNGPSYFRHLLSRRTAESNKGTYGHVLVVGGAAGKAGAAEMAGIAALRAGAGLVTVACSTDRLFSLELMTARLPKRFVDLPAERKNVIAIGPGLGLEPTLVRETLEWSDVPVVMDADALNSLGSEPWEADCVITPHPGEMARLTALNVDQVQRNRIDVARKYAEEHGCTVVLKGHRTVVALADGRVWINPTGSPAMATGGTGDILTGLIAGCIAQWSDRVAAVLAAVYLHGLAGELGARKLGEQGLIATDLLTYLPEAIRACHDVPDGL